MEHYSLFIFIICKTKNVCTHSIEIKKDCLFQNEKIRNDLKKVQRLFTEMSRGEKITKKKKSALNLLRLLRERNVRKYST